MHTEIICQDLLSRKIPSNTTICEQNSPSRSAIPVFLFADRKKGSSVFALAREDKWLSHTKVCVSTYYLDSSQHAKFAGGPACVLLKETPSSRRPAKNVLTSKFLQCHACAIVFSPPLFLQPLRTQDIVVRLLRGPYALLFP